MSDDNEEKKEIKIHYKIIVIMISLSIVFGLASYYLYREYIVPDKPEAPSMQTVLTKQVDDETTITVKMNTTDKSVFDLDNSFVNDGNVVWQLGSFNAETEYIDPLIQAMSEECKSLGGNLVHESNYVEKRFLFFKYYELGEPTLIMKCYDEQKNEIEVGTQ